MKNPKALLCVFLATTPLLSFGATFRNPFFENARIVRENANALNASMAYYADEALNEALNEPDDRAKHIWLNSGHVDHRQKEMHGLGYTGDTFLVNVGVDFKCSNLFSFLDRCIIGLFASQGHTDVDYKGSETLDNDKIEHGFFAFGLYSGYKLKRWTLFSSSLFDFRKYNNKTSMHSGNDLSGPLAKIGSHKFRGHSSHSNLGISYKCQCKRLTIEPMASLNYEIIEQRSHDHGTISLEKQRADYLQATLGVKLGIIANINSCRVEPHLFLGVARDLYSRNKLSEKVHHSSGNQIPQTLFERGRNSVKTGAGISVLVKDAITVDVSYQGEYSKHHKASAFTLGVNCKF